MAINSFLDAALEVLSGESRPLHYRDITKFALDRGLIESEGKTPWATMNAQISVDIQKKGEGSRFYRVEPGFYGANKENKKFAASERSVEITGAMHSINTALTSKQKGDIAEARVAELITLYGDEGLSCYRPVSDDEGIDLIVKRRGLLDVVYIQVKSSYGYGPMDRGFVSTVKERSIQNKERMLMVFVYFDLSIGDFYDQIFCIPAPKFLELTRNDDKKPGERVFTVGLKNPDKSKYAEFMIEKRELANRIIEIMNKL